VTLDRMNPKLHSSEVTMTRSMLQLLEGGPSFFIQQVYYPVVEDGSRL
jgi:hypothetical protein